MGNIKVQSFGKLTTGQDAFLYTISNKKNMCIKVTDFGASMTSILIPQKNGTYIDVLLGFDSVAGYEKTGLYLGATIGRYAGQIKGGRFVLNGVTYNLGINDHGNTLHGGEKGFDKRHFTAQVDKKNNKVLFRCFIRDGEDGFPGNLEVMSSFQLTDDNEIIMQHMAVSDRDTVLNMTNHNYYNLDGHESGNVENHKLKIYGRHFLELGDDCCPNGNVLPVENTPMDFMRMRRIGEYIEQPYSQLSVSDGYDHNWNVEGPVRSIKKTAELENSSGSVSMEMLSDLPGLQFYSGNYLNGSELGKNNCSYGFRGGLCLEPQYYPAAPEYKQFPSTVIKKGETYHQNIHVKFNF